MVVVVITREIRRLWAQRENRDICYSLLLKICFYLSEGKGMYGMDDSHDISYRKYFLSHQHQTSGPTCSSIFSGNKEALRIQQFRHLQWRKYTSMNKHLKTFTFCLWALVTCHINGLLIIPILPGNRPFIR